MTAGRTDTASRMIDAQPERVFAALVDPDALVSWLPRRFLPELIQLIWDRKIDPGKVFDKTLPLDRAAEACDTMDKRDAIKVLLTP